MMRAVYGGQDCYIESANPAALGLMVSQLVWTWSACGKPNNYNANSNQLTIEWE